MTEVELLTKQVDMLKQTMKTIAMDKKTPKWIVDLCYKTAMESKKLKESFNTETGVVHEFIPGAIVKDHGNIFVGQERNFTWKVLSYSTTLEGINLWNLEIVNGDDGHPAGTQFHNMAENLFYFA